MNTLSKSVRDTRPPFIAGLALFWTWLPQIVAAPTAVPRPEHPDIAGYTYTLLTDVEQQATASTPTTGSRSSTSRA
jgi:hypothetical protein